MNQRKGMTLIEVIVALALVGIISIGLITPMVAQYRLISRTKGITTNAFEIQQEVEDRLYEVRKLLVPAGNIQTIADAQKDKVSTIEFDGQSIKMYKMDMKFNENDSKTVSMFLSQNLAKNEKSSALEIEEVWIKGTNKTAEVISDTADTSKLEAMITEDHNTEKYTSLYKWYVSKEGISDPVSLENDYELIDLSVAALKSNKLNDLKKYSNKYIVVSVTPVDIHGRRGNEKFSSNRAYVRGEEWRAGTFAWVDKDRNGVYEASDYKLIKNQKLIEPLDTNKFEVYGASSEIEIKELNAGYLFVPQRLNEGDNFRIIAHNNIDWKIKNGIYLANDITANSESDIKLTTVDGNVVLYNFANINNLGEVILKDGKTEPTNKGSSIIADKDIYLTAGGKGNILLQKKASLKGENLILSANGKAEFYTSTLTARKSIDIDTTKALNILTPRDIKLDKTVMQIQASSGDSNIRLNSRDDVSLKDSIIKGEGKATSYLDIKAKGKIIIENTLMENITVNINSEAVFSGETKETLINQINTKMILNADAEFFNDVVLGSASEIIIKDGFSATFKKNVNNLGLITAGDKGELVFEPSMAEALENELNVSLEGDANQIVISNNYGRNIGLAGPISEEADLSGTFRPLGTGATNLEYSIKGDIPGLESIYITFDGTDKISISAIGSAEMKGSLTLTIRDRYTSPQISAEKTISINGGS